MSPPEATAPFSILPPNTVPEAMDILENMIKKAYPSKPSEIGRALLFGGSKKSLQLKDTLREAINQSLTELFCALNAPEGQAFFALLREHLNNATPVAHDAFSEDATLTSTQLKQQRQLALLNRIQGPLNEKLTTANEPLTAAEFLLLIDLFTATGAVNGFFENTWTEEMATDNKPKGVSEESQNKWQSLDEFLMNADFESDNARRDFARSVLGQRFGFMLRENAIRPSSGIIQDLIDQVKNPDPERLAPYFRHMTGKESKEAPAPSTKPSR